MKKITQIESIEASEIFNKFDSLTEQIKQIAKGQSVQVVTNELLTREDLCTIFRVSLPTILDWSKKGILTAYKVANRVYFKRSEIDKALISINNPKQVN